MAAMKPPPARSASTTGRDPLAGVGRLLIDGSNLLYRMSRNGPGAGPRPPAALIGRLRAAIPAATRIELVLDGRARARAGRRAHRQRPDRAPQWARLGRLTCSTGWWPTPSAAVARPRRPHAPPTASWWSPTIASWATGSDGVERRVAGATWLIGRLDRPQPRLARDRPPAAHPRDPPSRPPTMIRSGPAGSPVGVRRARPEIHGDGLECAR